MSEKERPQVIWLTMLSCCISFCLGVVFAGCLAASGRVDRVLDAYEEHKPMQWPRPLESHLAQCGRSGRATRIPRAQHSFPLSRPACRARLDAPGKRGG